MTVSLRRLGRVTGVSVRAMIVMTVLLGVVYTFAITGIGQLVLPEQARGSIVTNAEGDPVGSALIGQSFSDADGDPLPEYFQPRPSAAGEGYNAGASSGSNYGPENATLIEAIAARKAQVAEFNGVTEEEVPADAVTASASGLDPDISPAYAEIQIARVAEARGMSAAEVRGLVAAHTQAPDLGYLGESRVNVLALNLALDEQER